VILMDDARFFQGSGGRPTLAAVAGFAASHGWACDARDDIIRLTPGKANWSDAVSGPKAP
jgi:hypothetical protein